MTSLGLFRYSRMGRGGSVFSSDFYSKHNRWNKYNVKDETQWMKTIHFYQWLQGCTYRNSLRYQIGMVIFFALSGFFVHWHWILNIVQLQVIFLELECIFQVCGGVQKKIKCYWCVANKSEITPGVWTPIELGLGISILWNNFLQGTEIDIELEIRSSEYFFVCEKWRSSDMVNN